MTSSTILVAVIDPQLRRVILNAPVAEGHCVLETAHYNDAPKILRKTRPDLALVDFDTQRRTPDWICGARCGVRVTHRSLCSRHNFAKEIK
jgi:hypothetical protein